MESRIILKIADGTEIVFEDILSFTFEKNAYMPYTSFSAVACSEIDSIESVSEVSFIIGGKRIHHGICDTLDIYTENGKGFCRIVSKGFTSLLCRNQLEEGLKTNISFNALMESFYTLPFVEHEDNSDTSNYIYVKPNSVMWDGVVNLAYKLYGRYPYIRGTNTVRITPIELPVGFVYRDNAILKKGIRINTSRIISDYHMADINGSYGEFELINNETHQLNIIRNNFSELDKQFLYSPQEALVFRDCFNTREKLSHYFVYSGYNGEDITDIVTFSDTQEKKITGVKIIGNSKGIFTEISVNNDYFNRE